MLCVLNMQCDHMMLMIYILSDKNDELALVCVARIL